MSFEEKVTWVNVVTTVIAAAVYAWIVGSQLTERPVDEIAYQVPILIAGGAVVGLTIAGTIAMAIATAVRAEITGQGSVDDIDRRDERDVHIDRRGDLVSYYVVCGFMIGVLAITMLEYAHFWIANAILASFLVAGLAGSVVKVVAYRRGF